MIKLRNWKHILSNCRQCNQSPDGDHTTTSSNTSSKPEVGGSVKPLYGLFWGETGNGVWKRNADSAFHHCKTFKDVMEETISAMANRVLDAPVVDAYSTQAHISRSWREGLCSISMLKTVIWKVQITRNGAADIFHGAEGLRFVVYVLFFGSTKEK